MLTQTQLIELLHYNPETGLFVWRKGNPPGKCGPIRRPGSIANKPGGAGYFQIYIEGRRYQASNLAWLYMTGEWPSKQLDHINLNRADDRWENLRLASRAENCANRNLQSSNTSGCRGVWFQDGKWKVRVTANRKVHYGGTFESFEDAVAMRNKMAAELHKEFVQVDIPSMLPTIPNLFS